MNQQAQRYQMLKVARDQFGCTPGALDEQQRQQARRVVERYLQLEEAVLHSPQAVGVVVPQAQVDMAWAQISQRYETPEALQQALHEAQLEETQVREMLAREQRVDAVFERVSAAVEPLSDVDYSLYYFTHLERFTRPAARQARHILITINPDFPENQRDAALARIQAIARRLRSKPQRFAEQALKHSECPTSLQGGLLGNVTRGTLYPELEACLFGLHPGQLSKVVESPLGFHLLLCEALHAPVQLSLEEVMPQLREQLGERQRLAHQRRWLESLLQ